MGPAGLRRDGCLAAAATALFSLVIAGVHTADAAPPRALTAGAATLTSAVAGPSPAHRVATAATVRAVATSIDANLESAIRQDLSRSTGTGFTAVVDVAGVGRVARLHASHAERPASTQKLFTTGPLLLEMSQRVLRTDVRASTQPAAGVIKGNLVVTARRDPSMTRTALHHLAAAVHAAGVRRVTGRLNIDIGTMSLQTRRDGWKADSVPWDIGPLSPFPVNEDAYRHDPGYLSHPTTGNGALFRKILADEGVTVTGGVAVVRSSSAGVVLATHVSPAFHDMVKHTLQESDNFFAESFLFLEGSWRVHRLISTAGVPDSTFTDGSGLSYTDRESARGEVKLLHFMRSSSAGDMLLASLPVGCQTGTLTDWFCNTIGEGKVWAKTGTLAHDRALSGFTVDKLGRRVTFSILVRGVRDLTAARKAIAQAVIAMRRYSGS